MAGILLSQVDGCTCWFFTLFSFVFLFVGISVCACSIYVHESKIKNKKKRKTCKRYSLKDSRLNWFPEIWRRFKQICETKMSDSLAISWTDTPDGMSHTSRGYFLHRCPSPKQPIDNVWEVVAPFKNKQTKWKGGRLVTGFLLVASAFVPAKPRP